MTPFRIEFKTDCATPLSAWKQQAEINAGRPRAQRGVKRGRPLAVVGGSPQVIHDLDELRAWPGDIWAINYTASWLLSHGIESTLFTVDPGDPVDPVLSGSPVSKRLLAASCSPSMFTDDSLAIDLIETHPQGFPGGTSSATRAPWIALSLGYDDVSFFGCEGSYEGSDHVDRHEETAQQLIVRAGGVDYLTRPDYFVQSQELARLFSEFGTIFKNRSGGLVKAMLDYPDTWEVVAVSAALKQHLEEVNGAQGLYDHAYERPVAA